MVFIALHHPSQIGRIVSYRSADDSIAPLRSLSGSPVGGIAPEFHRSAHRRHAVGHALRALACARLRGTLFRRVQQSVHVNTFVRSANCLSLRPVLRAGDNRRLLAGAHVATMKVRRIAAMRSLLLCKPSIQGSRMLDTTSHSDNSLVSMVCPFTGEVLEVLTPQQVAQRDEQREQVRQRCVKEFSSSPLYQARAEKDPEYWNTFYVGRVL
nr:hypothetical protein [Aromatoleum toluclasticum]